MSSPNTYTPESIMAITEGMPQWVISLLERRYLNSFRENNWKISIEDNNNDNVYLREVKEISREHFQEEAFKSVPFILTSCHVPGFTYYSIVNNDGQKNRFFIGGKRNREYQTHKSIDEYMSLIYSSNKSFNNEIVLGDIYSLNSTQNASLKNEIKNADTYALLTGIPSGRNGVISLNSQGLDRVCKSVNGKFTLMVVSKAVAQKDLDDLMDKCIKLKSEIHSLIKTTKSFGKSTSKTSSITFKENTNDYKDTSSLLLGASLFLQTIRLIPGIPDISRITTLLNTGNMFYNKKNVEDHQVRNQSETESINQGYNIEVLDAHAEELEDLLNKYINRIKESKGIGLWNTAIYISAESNKVLNNVIGSLKSICSGDKTYLDPFREVRLPITNAIKHAMLSGEFIIAKPKELQGAQHPFGNLYNSLTTCLSSDELSVIAHLPVKEVAGVPMRRFARFALTAPIQDNDSIFIGNLYESVENELGRVRIPLKSLNLHTLIAGMPGFGKTTTCMQILTEAYVNFNIPFLVIEPAKKEYRQLVQLQELKSKIKIYSIEIDSPTPLRLNPLEFQQGVSIGKHIDLLKAVFNASFPMFAGMTYVLEEALLAVYQERGWNIFTSENMFLDSQNLMERYTLMPTLNDLYDQIESVLSAKKYSSEIQQNLEAALKSRIKSLTVGTKGLVLNTHRSIPIEELMNSPSVIELQDLGDDQEKAFVMALILINLYEHAELRQCSVTSRDKNTLQHLTLIEEAHRLLSGKSGAVSDEVGDPRSKAVSMFTDMLAEVRAYGEGLIISDQIPTKLAPEILKNTNLKIIHRLSSPDDRRLIGQALNLSDSQSDFLNNLPTFYSVIHDSNINEAILVKNYPFKQMKLLPKSVEQEIELLREVVSDVNIAYLRRHSGCNRCQNPCQYYHYQETAKLIFDCKELLKSIYDKFKLKRFDLIPEMWKELSNIYYSEVSQISKWNMAEKEGVLYCLSVHSLEDYIRESITNRVKIINSKYAMKNRLPIVKLKLSKEMALLSEFIFLLMHEDKKIDESILIDILDKIKNI